MTNEDRVNTFTATITTQLRAFGVELWNDVGDRMRPGGPEEQRVVRNIARNVVQVLINEEH
jgi:hypothetical protein